MRTMNGSLNLRSLFAPGNIRTLAGPLLIILILSMMVLPLPAFVLDLMFTFNIAVSVMVMLVAMYTRKPLDFSVFPTVLLVTTLLRLSLNVASTRVVLLEGHSGPDAAGKVIEAFGHFLVGGNTAVGLAVFIILTVINFVVITKGAGRIAEVGARFTLDAMPGKQMAIDADLNAGLIDEKEAKRRRAETSQEADFYGAMDGASKFVRGDAVAGILIMAINVVGGLIVGVLQHNMELGQAATNYTLLTIGDGLVAQLPALIISVAAGLVVSRVGDDGDMGSQVIGQVFSNPQVLLLTGAILGILGLIPGMPNFVFLLLASGLGYLAWRGGARQAELVEEAEAPTAAPVLPAESQEASWSDVTPVDESLDEDGLMGLPTDSITDAQAENAEIFMPELGKWLEVRSRYLNWVDGHIAQMVIATDITPRRQAEEQYAQQAERAHSVNRLITMGEMASSVAHELNQPLTAISNYCSGMVSRIKSQQITEDALLVALEKTAHQAQRAGQIIQRIRSFVKKSEPNRTPSDVTGMVAEAVELAGIELRRRNVRLSHYIAARLPTLLVDPILIEQVLVNLMKNAAESIDHANLPPARRNVELRVVPRQAEGRAVIEFSVADTGPGLAPEALERLFEAFFSTKSEGMGIGLNLCRSIVESHQGRMRAENIYNGSDVMGCRFSFWIPVANPALSP